MFDYSHTFADTLSKKPSRWLPYFMVMLGVGTAAAQETLLNYWFVYGDDESAALSRGESSRVLSVEGERGEFCRAIYNDVRKHPLVLKAWGDRQRMIRREVQELSRGYQAAGMAPMEAYVKAWQEVDRRYRFNKHTAGAPAVKKLLERLASEGGEQPLSDAEVQQVLQYLVAVETRLELEEGRRLTELISRQRPQTSVNFEQQIEGVNDELMALFASALGHNIEGPQAFREAWFKLNRHRLVNHTLVGYRAPWGCGLGKQPHYRQAPQKVSTTVGSANTLSVSPQSGAESQPSVSLTIPQQESLQPDFTTGMNSSAGRLENFLATSPLLPEEGKQEDKEKDKETGLDGEDESFAVSAPPLPQQPMMMRSFSLRSAAAPVDAAAQDVGSVLDVNGKAVLYITDDGYTASGKTRVNSVVTNLTRSYEVINHGSYHSGTMNRQTLGGVSFWKGDGKDLSWWFESGEKTVNSKNDLTGQYGRIRLDGTDVLHIGGLPYRGTIEVTSAAGAAATECPVIGSYDDTPTLYQPGNLSGSGSVLLRGYNSTDTTATFQFNGTDKENWFAGTVYMSSNGGTVQLNITDDRWQNTVFDLTSSASYSKTLTGGTGKAPEGIKLNVDGVAQVLGVKGGTAGISVIMGDGVLTFGCDGVDYSYSGDVSSTALELVKRGSNNQTFTGTIDVATLGIYDGTVTTTGSVSAHAELRGGVTWCMDGAKTAGVVSFSLVDMYGRPVTLTSTGDSSWKGFNSLDLSASGLTSYNTALFDVSGNLELDLTASQNLFISGVSGSWKAGDRIAVYSGNLQGDSFDGRAVSLTLNSVKYNATWEKEGDILYVQLGDYKESSQPPLGSEDSYIWTGEQNGTIIDDASRETYGLKMGSVWRADNSPENSGWGEQHAQGVSVGVYVNGYAVAFKDKDFYGVAENDRDVWVQGTVAPGSEILIEASNSKTSNGLSYGYAFTGGGCIADFGDKKTSIRSTGGTMLVLNTSNTFSGGVTLEAGNLYLGCDKAAGSGEISLASGAELIVNYNSQATNYRTPLVENHIAFGGNGTISYGNASYAEDKQSCEWRHVQLTGGVSGSGTLTLSGFTSSENSTTNYVSSFIINEGNAPVDAGRFAGTVVMKNAFNTETVTGSSNTSFGGAVQLSLQDSVFSDAVLDMTREVSTVKKVGVKRYILSSDVDYAQTSDNILVVENDVAIKGLEAGFVGSSWRHSRSITFSVTLLDSVNPSSERWRVRVVTPSSSILTLQGDDNANTSYVYSGAMGYAQSYTAPGQAFINEYTGGSGTDASFSAGGGTLGQTQLSLVKQGASSQYIHSADLLNLSVYQGKLGFNNLTLRGNLIMVGGSHLVLGETGQTGWNAGGTASENLSMASGKTLLVYTPQESNGTPFPQAQLTGDVTMSADSTLAFYVTRATPSTSSSESLLKVNGALTLSATSAATTEISLNFSSVEFALQADPTQPYYLAEFTEGLKFSGSGFNIDDINGKLISLGYGYYGVLGVKDSSTKDYLTMTVSGDPRCTWSGNVDAVPGTADGPKSYEWYTTAYEKNNRNEYVRTMANDYRWKEQLLYQDAQVVLFGNLNTIAPADALHDAEAGVDYYTSEQTAKVTEKAFTGTLVTSVAAEDVRQGGFTIDGKVLTEADAYQAVLVNDTVKPLSVVINSDYKQGNILKVDDTNYYFFGAGGIADAEDWQLGIHGFDASWKTDLRKMGLGTAVMALSNSYSGGTMLEGGRLVMQHEMALGSGGVRIQNGAVLQGDYADVRTTGTWSSAYDGEGMLTTTIGNAVTAQVFVDPTNPDYMHAIDAYIANSYDKKLVLDTLTGSSDAVVALYGNSLADGNEKYTYAVFKVLDPGEFYGTVVMDGNLAQHDVYTNLWDANADNDSQGGNVQMEIMSTTKATGGGNWLNATVDLSVQFNTTRTVLALDAYELSDENPQIVLLDSLKGSGENSSVLNMSAKRAITLELRGRHNGAYEGVLGFGDFQKTVDYVDSGASDIGTIKHHFGGRGKLGELNVNKLGAATQEVHGAWLNQLYIGQDHIAGTGSESYVQRDEIGGRFIVDSALVVSDIKVVSGSHLYVENSASASVHALTVGAGGILALENDRTQDVFENIRPGIPAYVAEVPIPGSSDGETEQVAVAPSSFVLFEDGATITAGSDWYTRGPSNREMVTLYNGETGQNVFMEYSLSIDIANGASVTFNTHHYTPDATINSNPGQDLYGEYGTSHVMQLLSKMQGKNVNLVFNNVQMSTGSRVDRTYGSIGSETGYVALLDLNQFTGDVSVKDKTVLQITESNDAANFATADIDVTVSGFGAALQFVDGVEKQYMSNLTLENEGCVLLGGTLKNERKDGLNHADGVELVVSVRDSGAAATVNNLSLSNKETYGGNAVGMQGSTSSRAVFSNASISTQGTTSSLTVGNAILADSLIRLNEECSLDLTEAVLMTAGSVVQGAQVSEAAVAGSGGALVEPVAATNTVQTSADTTVMLTFADAGRLCTVGKSQVLLLKAEQFLGVNVTGDGLTLRLTEDSETFLNWGLARGVKYLAIQVGGGSGQFQFEDAFESETSVGAKFVIRNSKNEVLTEYWVTSTAVSTNLGETVSAHLLYFEVPEPTTTTLSLLALTALAMRRRRK